MFEDGSLTLKKEILENKTLEYFYSFENRQAIFADVHKSYKFALIQVKNTQANHTHKIKMMFYKTDINSLKNKDEILTLSLKAKPNSPSFNGVKRQTGFRNSKKMLQCFSKLVF